MIKSVKKVINKIFKVFGLKLVRIKLYPQQKLVQNEMQASVKTQSQILNGLAEPPFNTVPFAGETLQYLVQNYEFQTILDIGSGEGKHSDLLRKKGKMVISIDYGKSVYFNQSNENHICITADYYTYNFENKFDAIWASHVLEHQPNPNLFLKKVHKDLKEGGILAITVPPLKHQIVGGHLTLWNAGLLLYQLVIAGFDCKEVSIKSYGYNISVVLKKRSIKKFPELSFDKGDIEKLSDFFPNGFKEPFNGDIKILNWF